MDAEELVQIEAIIRRVAEPEAQRLLHKLVRETRHHRQVIHALINAAPDQPVPPPPRRGGLRVRLLVQHHRGKPDLFCPSAYCDGCGGLIQGSGNYLYDPSTVAESESGGELFTFHKGCDRPFEHLRGERWFWGELERLPIELAANLGLSVRALGGRRYTIDKPRGNVEGPPLGGPEVPKKSVRLDPRRTFSALQKEEIFRRSGGYCQACGLELDLDWHADHIYPHSLGGVTEVVNGQSLCQSCNSRKSAKVLTVEGGEE